VAPLWVSVSISGVQVECYSTRGGINIFFSQFCLSVVRNENLTFAKMRKVKAKVGRQNGLGGASE